MQAAPSLHKTVIRMAEWLPHNSSIDCVLHDSKFWVQLYDQEGCEKSLRQIHVKDLRGEEVGRLSVQGYEALSSAFVILERFSPLERWECLVEQATGPKILDVYATNVDAVISLFVATIAGRQRFVAVIRDMFSGGAQARVYMKQLLGSGIPVRRSVQAK